MRELIGKKYLVTGGAGFIGSHICEEIVKQGKEVICLDNLVAGKMSNLQPWWDPKLCTFVKQDICQFANIMYDSSLVALFEGVDVVFHNAASKCNVCRMRPALDLLVNAWGSLCIFEAARRSGAKVVHASTGSVYGDGIQDPPNAYFLKREMQNTLPKSFYGVSKLAAEGYLKVLKEYHPSFRYTILRYFHVYGPRQDYGEFGGVIPIFIKRAYDGEPLVIYGDGHQTRSFTHVKDVVNANFAMANIQNLNAETFNCASGIKVTVKELAEMVKRMAGQGLEIIYRPWRPGDIKFFNVDNTKILKYVKFSTNFEEDLKSTIDWYWRYFESKKL